MQLGKTLDNTPLGCRIVFGASIGAYLLYTLDHHDFISWNLVCRPVDVIYSVQLQRLVLTSLVHKSALSLTFALFICSRRFAWLENLTGTLGFLVWFFWTSVVVHGAYCFIAMCLAPILGQWLMSGEVRGLFPLITAHLVASIKDSDNSCVSLWPLPFHVPVRAFPLVVICLCWVFHMEAHFDVIVAYAIASAAPQLVVEPSQIIVDKVEQTAAGTWLLARLQAFDSFACKQPESGRGGDLPLPATHPASKLPPAASSGSSSSSTMAPLSSTSLSASGSSSAPPPSALTFGAGASGAVLAGGASELSGASSLGSSRGELSAAHALAEPDEAAPLDLDDLGLAEEYDRPWH